MCGIAGIAGLNNKRQQCLEKMTQKLHHRGPDDVGTYHDDHVSLGQTRLSIVDIEGGHQPIFSTDGNLILIANGEIYNSPEQRAFFVNEGYQFQTKTDVEVILPLYQKYGRDCVKHLRGMFAFAIWDKAQQQLYMARDHMGQKPLFYHLSDDGITFASEVKAILGTGLVEPQIEKEALWHYMSMRYVPDQLTFFKGINKLPAATWLSYSPKEGITTDTYWSLDFTKKMSTSEDDIIEALDNKLQETVSSHLLSDVRVGAFLSGGIDSSLISAMMAKNISEPVPVFTIGVKEQAFNEIPFAEEIATQYKMEHHAEVVSADVVKLLPKMIYQLDEPADPFGMGVYLVSRLAKKHVKVVLTGDGGDETFAGYDRFIGQQLAQHFSHIPAAIRKHVVGRLINFIPETFQYKTLASKARWLNEMSFFKAGDRYAHSMSFLRFTNDHKNQLFTQASRDEIQVKNSSEKILEHFNSDAADTLLDRMLYTDLKTRIPDHLLSISDRMCMAHGLENRSPFMDFELVQFAASMPTHLKMKNRTLKYMLRKVSKGYMSDGLINRKKQGFGFPIAQWMQHELANVLRNLFTESRFVELGIFNQDYMMQLLDEHVSGKQDHNFRLWILLNLELWYRIYFEGADLDDITDTISGWL